MDALITADYYAETTDEKIAGQIVLRPETLVACYSLPGYTKRTMILTEQGLKFCLKGKPSQFMTAQKPSLLKENNAPVAAPV